MNPNTLSNHGNIGQQIGTQIFNGNIDNYNHSQRVNEQSSNSDDQALLKSLQYAGMFDGRNNIEQPHPSTCQWLLSNTQYLSWKDDIRGIMWVKGKPGSGKSTIMSFLLDFRERNDDTIHLEFFFHGRGSELQQTSTGMCRSLLHQLLTRTPVAWKVMRDHCRRKTPSTGSSEYWTWQRVEVERLFTRSILACSADRIEIFVDAIDESGIEEAPRIARYFHELNQLARSKLLNVKICISRRHYPVVSILREKEIVMEDENQKDITLLAHDRLKRLHEENTPQLDQWEKLEQYILQNARGIFQWVRCVLSLVEASCFDGLPVQAIWQHIQRVPQELAEMYDFVVRKVINHRFRAESFVLFQWTSLAFKPLRLIEMFQALAISIPARTTGYDVNNMTDAEKRLRISSLSGGLIEVSSDNVVQVVHQSVNDYLLTDGFGLLKSLSRSECSDVTTIKSEYSQHASIAKLHAEIYWLCLNHIVNAFQSGSDQQREANFYYRLINGHVLSPGLPLLHYILDNLFKHAQRAQRERSHDLAHEIRMLKCFARINYLVCESAASINDMAPPWAHVEIPVLHIAVIYKSVDLVLAVLRSTPDLEAQDPGGMSAIHHAVRGGDLSIIEALWQAGASLNSKERGGESPLRIAFVYANVALAEWLIDHGAVRK